MSPSRGAAGITVTITGLNLKGATKVLFGPAAAKFTVVSAAKITATVPAGNGKVAVTVTTPAWHLGQQTCRPVCRRVLRPGPKRARVSVAA